VHKMLTGRAELAGLRTAGGVSGYPDRAESAHDVVENSHASGSIACAHGIDHARRLAGQESLAVAVAVDSSRPGDVPLDALNELCTALRSRAVVALNMTTRPYAPTHGGLAGHPRELLKGPLPAGADMFTALGLTYLGPIDGHDHTALA